MNIKKFVSKPVDFKSEFLASIVVFLVALPLCMGVALASGMPASAGLITGIVGGIVVSLVSGSSVQVSGPAAGLSVIVWEIAQQTGLEKLALIIVLAGLLQAVAGMLKLGQWFRAISPAVVNGMLSGIGVLILASQFHIMVDDSPKANGISNLLSIPQAVINALLQNDVHSIGSSHQLAALIGLTTIALILIWSKAAPSKLRLVPASLVAVLGATLVSVLWQLPVKHVTLPDSLFSAISVPSLQTLWSGFWDPQIWVKAGALAFIASAETLLSATALDRMHKGPKTQYDRELIAQGIGNTICGALGALPMTGVIVRSSVNVQAGAKTRLSSFLHGVWLLLFVLMLPFVLRLIPTASLAALLVYTGYKLFNWRVYKELMAFGKTEVAIWVTTIAMIVATDLLTGVLVGVILSIAKLLYIFSHLSIKTRKIDDRAFVLELDGAATFFSLPKLAAALENMPGDCELHVEFEHLRHIDHACLDLLMNWEKQHESTGGCLVIDWGNLHAIFQTGGRRAELETVLSASSRR